jgi:hypothetical protein
MQTIDIPIQQGQWLTEALRAQGYRNIPANTIIKKTLPGLGATYGEIKAHRHSIIIEPNVPVILGKTKDKPELLAVWENCTQAKIKNYLRDNAIRYKKLLTTPESFYKIRKVCNELKINMYRDFFCLFDECEKIVQDIDYRDSINQPINDFFLFENKALVSATTLNMSHPEFENQNFRILEIKPQYDYRKNIDLILTNDYATEVTGKLNELRDSECICVFLNKTDSIDDLIHTLRLDENFKVFCSNKSVRKLKNKGFENVFDQIDLPLAKYNFFTCRFFSAVDIEIREKPDILILTDLKAANHTMIDPFTEAIQIYGRFRDKYHRNELPFHSLTHITNINPNLEIKSRETIDREIGVWRRNYERLKEDLQNTGNADEKNAIQAEMKNSLYSELLDETENFNCFSLDNLYNEERVKGYYSNPDLLIQAYTDTNHFLVNPIIHDDVLHLIDFRHRYLSNPEKRKQIVEELEKLEAQKEINPGFDTEYYKNLFKKQEITNRESGELIVEAYYYLGKSEIERIGYGHPKILKEATDKKKVEEKEKNMFSVIQNKIKAAYPISKKAPKNKIKAFLQEIYRLNGIDIAIAHDTIKKYCNVTSDNSVK